MYNHQLDSDQIISKSINKQGSATDKINQQWIVSQQCTNEKTR